MSEGFAHQALEVVAVHGQSCDALAYDDTQAGNDLPVGRCLHVEARTPRGASGTQKCAKGPLPGQTRTAAERLESQRPLHREPLAALRAPVVNDFATT